MAFCTVMFNWVVATAAQLTLEVTNQLKKLAGSLHSFFGGVGVYDFIFIVGLAGAKEGHVFSPPVALVEVFIYTTSTS